VTLGAILALAPLGVPLAPAARAATPALRVVLTDVVASGNAPTDRVTVSGTVTNVGSAPVFDVRATQWRSTAQLRSLQAVTDALGASQPPTGGVITTVDTALAHVTTPASALEPGASGSFTVSATLAELSLSADASYWVGVRLTAATKANGGSDAALTAQAQTLTTLPGTTVPSIVTVVDLSATPRRLRPSLFADDGLAAELAEPGRLARLLDVAGRPGVSWAIDPSLLAEVIDMSNGYSVVDGSGTRPGSGVEAAKVWLAAFQALPEGSGVRSLYGHPDLVGAAAAGSSAVLDRALEATATSRVALPTVAVQARVSAAALAELGRRGVPVLTAAAGTRQRWVTMGGARVASALSLDAPVTSPAIGDSPDSRAAIAVALARAAGSQVRLVATPEAAEADAQASPSWTVRRSLTGLLDAAPGATAEPGEPAVASGALTTATVARLDQVRRDLDAYVSAAPSSQLGHLPDALGSNAAGEAWLADAAGRQAYLDAVADAWNIADGIGLSATRTVTLSSEQSQFPATITNRLADSISVRVVGVSDNSARMTIERSELVTIRPGDSLTVLLTASARSNGVVGATLHVETADGVPVSGPVPVTIEATNLGRVGWVIVAASGAVLVVSTALRIIQVRRRRTRP
jgi:hypothetical protein